MGDLAPSHVLLPILRDHGRRLGQADPQFQTQRLREFVGNQHFTPAPAILSPLRGEGVSLVRCGLRALTSKGSAAVHAYRKRLSNRHGPVAYPRIMKIGYAGRAPFARERRLNLVPRVCN